MSFRFKWPHQRKEGTPRSTDFPNNCCVCGKTLEWVTERNGYWEDNGEERNSIWLKCPDWKDGRTMIKSHAFICYTALELNRRKTAFVPMFAYTRYQTCDETVVY